MIWRIRERQSFRRLTAEGDRARAGALWCHALLDPPESRTPPRVAFAIGRAVGPAATRNRLRRRLRAVVQTAARDGAVPSGMFLIGARPEAIGCTVDELTASVRRLLAQLTGRPT